MYYSIKVILMPSWRDATWDIYNPVMCILFIALDKHPDYPLIIAANRDEEHARPSRSMHWWEDRTGVFAGRDLTAGGTWLGVNATGAFAAVTNFRTGEDKQYGTRSRGELVAGFLQDCADPESYEGFLQQHHQEFSPFNLVFGDQNNLFTWGYDMPRLQSLSPGFHSVSNGPMDTLWPKMSRGVKELSIQVRTGRPLQGSSLLPIMLDRSPAPDDELPQTGLKKGKERWLSPIYILGPEYGTRTTSILRFQREGVDINEYEHDPTGPSLTGTHHRIEFTADSHPLRG